MSSEITILGCGVSGLTCGILLLEKGADVKILADRLPPDITSNVAAAYWYPYKVGPEEKVLKWAVHSYNKFLELSNIPDTGVSVTELVKLFDHVEEPPFWRVAVNSYRRETGENLFNGYVDVHISEVPLIETPVYMKYLMESFRRLGGKVEKTDSRISSPEELNIPGGIVINCTGLGSYELFQDKTMFPIRGQLIRTTNPGLKKIVSDEDGPLGLSYIVPRSNDCILGGTAEENNWNLEVSFETADDILRKCSQLEPRLKDVNVLEHKVGLRPGRTEVRLEKEKLSGFTVIHNYGHGGAGFTLSWGCAEDVVALVQGE